MTVADAPDRPTASAQIDALEAEGQALAEVLATLTESDWQRTTGFKDWRIWDVVAHLHLTDHMGLTTIDGPEPFKALLKRMGAFDGDMAAYARDWLGDLSGRQLFECWRRVLAELCAGLRAADPDVRLTWPGPGMKPRMFATARQMETWAHGWEIYDELGLERSHDDRLENIATIGVRTYGWSFANRKLEPPAPAPYVELTAPSGRQWCYNEPQSDNRIRGSAVEFCQVVTQVRHVEDTALEVQGEPATAWMAVAQCFAGPPVEPPKPGTRGPKSR
ncbi:MAG: TIGR03084 family metal-binding protein [Pseudomonadota bacterium]